MMRSLADYVWLLPVLWPAFGFFWSCFNCGSLATCDPAVGDFGFGVPTSVSLSVAVANGSCQNCGPLAGLHVLPVPGTNRCAYGKNITPSGCSAWRVAVEANTAGPGLGAAVSRFGLDGRNYVPASGACVNRQALIDGLPMVALPSTPFECVPAETATLYVNF